MKLFIALALCGFAIVNSEDIPECIIKSLKECHVESKKLVEAGMVWYAGQNEENANTLCGGLEGFATCAEPKIADNCEPDDAVTFGQWFFCTLLRGMHDIVAALDIPAPESCLNLKKKYVDDKYDPETCPTS